MQGFSLPGNSRCLRSRNSSVSFDHFGFDLYNFSIEFHFHLFCINSFLFFFSLLLYAFTFTETIFQTSLLSLFFIFFFLRALRLYVMYTDGPDERYTRAYSFLISSRQLCSDSREKKCDTNCDGNRSYWALLSCVLLHWPKLNQTVSNPPIKVSYRPAQYLLRSGCYSFLNLPHVTTVQKHQIS